MKLARWATKSSRPRTVMDAVGMPSSSSVSRMAQASGVSSPLPALRESRPPRAGGACPVSAPHRGYAASLPLHQRDQNCVLSLRRPSAPALCPSVSPPAVPASFRSPPLSEHHIDDEHAQRQERPQTCCYKIDDLPRADPEGGGESPGQGQVRQQDGVFFPMLAACWAWMATTSGSRAHPASPSRPPAAAGRRSAGSGWPGVCPGSGPGPLFSAAWYHVPLMVWKKPALSPGG